MPRKSVTISEARNHIACGLGNACRFNGGDFYYLLNGDGNFTEFRKVYGREEMRTKGTQLEAQPDEWGDMFSVEDVPEEFIHREVERN